MVVSCHRTFLPGTCPEPAVIHYYYYYYYHYYYTLWMSPVIGLFFPVLLLNQQ